MGCINSTEEKASNEINSHYQAAARVDEEEKRLLLLGTGDGKSTIFKNLRKSKGEVIRDERTIEETANTVRSNLVHFMIKLLLKSQQLYDADHEANKGCKLPDDDPKIVDYTRMLLKHGIAYADDFLPPDADTEQLGEAIAYLWKIPAVQETFQKKGDFSFPDNLDFFYNKCKIVMGKGYAPEEEDIIKARVRTTGVYCFCSC
ncbi:guanine nucleotide-binding protein subunit alpha [Reticulomyxa filosa]|uniref:Guanine nucleotide-binding protein subunit alpha n=1 Tax=Reticulomyxa filosa TaxID=46433 RepID=X6PFJ9_RETFI|nr:guanine nucleotide-binding protein subunit alpha [Reticulomyxa filosa]|eukprot:ETO36442.1 guanine nucleotide-binding protein subunit alpha [Reticulomyxa filosa]